MAYSLENTNDFISMSLPTLNFLCLTFGAPDEVEDGGFPNSPLVFIYGFVQFVKVLHIHLNSLEKETAHSKRYWRTQMIQSASSLAALQHSGRGQGDV